MAHRMDNTLLVLTITLLGCCGSTWSSSDGLDILGGGGDGGDLSGIFSLLGDALGGGDSCQHSCPNGHPPPAPRHGHKPRYNGCGTDFFKVDVSSYPKFTECCNKHDICYDTCHRGKAKRKGCDDDFKKCMKKTCKKHYANDVAVSGRKKGSQCHSTADMMHGGVVALGCEIYKDSQRGACSCERPTLGNL